MVNQPQRDQTPVRVGIADKSPLVRAGLRHLFENDERFDLVTVCNDGKSLLASLEDRPLDVAISGWVIEPSRGKYILDQLRGRPDAPRVIIYTGADDENIPVVAMAHGAAAFVSKKEETDYLLDTVASVGAGHMVFPFVDVRRIHLNPLSTLTHREMEVLAAAATGQSTKEIATAQDVSPNTVKFHLRNVYEKLGVSNRGQAIAIYLKS